MPADVWVKILYTAGIDGKFARKLAPLNSELAEAARRHEDNDAAAAAVRDAAQRRREKQRIVRRREEEERARQAQERLHFRERRAIKIKRAHILLRNLARALEQDNSLDYLFEPDSDESDVE